MKPTKLFSSQTDTSTSIVTTLNQGDNVYAIAYDWSSYDAIDYGGVQWTSVRTKDEQHGFVNSENIGLFTTHDSIGYVIIDGYKMGIYLAQTTENPPRMYDSTAVVTPVINLSGNDDTKFTLINFNDEQSIVSPHKDTNWILSDKFMQVFNNYEESNLTWIFSIVDNKLQIQRNYSDSVSHKNKQETHTFILQRGDSHSIYGVKEKNVQTMN